MPQILHLSPIVTFRIICFSNAVQCSIHKATVHMTKVAKKDVAALVTWGRGMGGGKRS